MSGRTFLKVKVKNLAEEAKIIRKEELRYKFKKVKLVSPISGDTGEYCWKRVPVLSKHIVTVDGLHNHRVHVVRAQARATQIAYAFVRGRAAKDVVPVDKRKVDFKEIWRMVRKYGPADLVNLPDQHELITGLYNKLTDWLNGHAV